MDSLDGVPGDLERLAQVHRRICGGSRDHDGCNYLSVSLVHLEETTAGLWDPEDHVRTRDRGGECQRGDECELHIDRFWIDHRMTVTIELDRVATDRQVK